MGKVHEVTTDDGVVLRWGDDGTEYPVDLDGPPEPYWEAYRKAVAQGLARKDVVETDVDRSVAREIQSRFGIRKDHNGGLILAWWPSPEEAQAIAALVPDVSSTVSPEDLHLTLLYLAESGWEEGDPREGKWDLQLVGAVVKLFARRWNPIECRIGGIGRFVMEEESDAVVLLMDCPELTSIRRCLEDDLVCHGAVPYTSVLFNRSGEYKHGWIPHVTIAYVPKTTSSLPVLTEAVSFEVSNVTVAAGQMRAVYPLEDWGYEENDEPRPLLYAKAKDAYALGKAGRVLSGKNLKALKDAVAAMQAVVNDEEKRRMREDDEYKEKRAEVLRATFGDPGDISYTVTKADDEKRYTLGPLYAPNRKDAHGEFVDADTLQAAVWDYVRQSRDTGGRIKLQHGDLGDVTVGEMVEVMSWPYDHAIKVRKAGGEEREIEMPAGTVYVGAIWDEDAWPFVKSGKLNGWSLGGKAVRVDSGVSLAEMAAMGDAGARKATTALDVVVLEAAAQAEAALRERELEGARKESDRLGSIVGQLVDAVKANFGRSPGDTHSHVHLEEGAMPVTLPAVNVDVRPEVKLDVVE